jgi:hypothetical protein
MKKLALLISAISYCVLCFAQTNGVGIGITTPIPEAMLQVHTGSDNTKGFLVTGFINNATLPTVPDLGAGSRLMFFPGKAAFRAGAVDSTQWNNVNVGRYSTGLGFNVRASADYSTAMGFQAAATGHGSLALGSGSAAKGDYSTAMGTNTTATGTYSTSLGFNTTAAGTYSTAMGFGTSATGAYSTSMGTNSVARGDYSTTMGFNNRANGAYSTAMGLSNVAKGYSSLVVGMYNDSLLSANQNTVDIKTPLFVVGNGWADNQRQNALLVTKNGLVHIDPSGKNNGTLDSNALVFGLWDTSPSAGIASSVNNNSNPGGLDFYTGKIKRMSITKEGRVGIGTTTPQHALDVAGSIRQETYQKSFSLPGNSANSYIWVHNMGYQPIIMISLDQTGGANCEYVTVSYYHTDNNTTWISLTNRNGAFANGIARWIVVY